MEVVLKRIKRSSFDELMKIVLDNFEENKVIQINDDVLEKNSEVIIVDGKQIRLDYSIQKYMDIADSEEMTYIKLTKIGMLLHKETKDLEGTIIPKNVLYEKEVWAYLSFKVFIDVVKKLRLDDDDKMTADKVARYYFNINKPSRTGLLFIWTMIDMLQSEDDYQMSEVAFHFIDPVKATYERTIARNPIVLKAYVQAIINNGCNPKIKDRKNRLKVPNNVSCFARINILDAYEYDELVQTMTEQIKNVLSIV